MEIWDMIGKKGEKIQNTSNKKNSDTTENYVRQCSGDMLKNAVITDFAKTTCSHLSHVINIEFKC